MKLFTTEHMPGSRVTASLGLVRGSSIRARHLGKDILAGLRNIAGGEVHEYSKLPVSYTHLTLPTSDLV